MSALTILLRFMFGFILAAGVGLWIHFDFPGDLIFALTVGALAAVWGDRFILGFMSLMRYLR